jgi:hypothetical protein
MLLIICFINLLIFSIMYFHHLYTIPIKYYIPQKYLISMKDFLFPCLKLTLLCLLANKKAEQIMVSF